MTCPSPKSMHAASTEIHILYIFGAFLLSDSIEIDTTTTRTTTDSKKRKVFLLVHGGNDVNFPIDRPRTHKKKRKQKQKEREKRNPRQQSVSPSLAPTLSAGLMCTDHGECTVFY